MADFRIAQNDFLVWDKYARGYYRYLWAKVLSADDFQAFAEAGPQSRQFGRPDAAIRKRDTPAATLEVFNKVYGVATVMVLL